MINQATSLLMLELSLYQLYIVIGAFTHASIIISTLFILFTLIIFARLRQDVHWLRVAGPRGLQCFTRCHTSTLLYCLEVNRFVSSPLSAFFLVNYPYNASLVMSIIMLQMRSGVLVVHVALIIAQLFGILVFHLISVQ